MTGGKGGKNAAEAPPGKLPAKASKKAKKAAAAAPENSPGGSSARAAAAGVGPGGGYQAHMNPGSLPYDPFTAGFPAGMNPYSPAFNPAAMAFTAGSAHAHQYAGMMPFPHGMPHPAGFQQAMPGGGHVLGGSGAPPLWAGGHAMPQLPQYHAVAPPAPTGPTVAQRRWRVIANALKNMDLGTGLTHLIFHKLQTDLGVPQRADADEVIFVH